MLPTGFDLCVSHFQFRVLLACSSCQLHHFLLPGVSVRGWDSLLVRVLGSRLKGCKFESPQEQGENFFFSGVNFVCWLLFGVCSTPVLPQWHIKDLGHSAKNAGGRLHLNRHTPLTQLSWSGLTMPLSRRSVETYQETSSRATCQGSFAHSCLCLPSHCGLILAERVELVYVSLPLLKKKKKKDKKAQMGKHGQTFSQNPLKSGQSHFHHPPPPPVFVGSVILHWAMTLQWDGVLKRFLLKLLSLFCRKTTSRWSGTAPWRWNWTPATLRHLAAGPRPLSHWNSSGSR